MREDREKTWVLWLLFASSSTAHSIHKVNLSLYTFGHFPQIQIASVHFEFFQNLPCISCLFSPSDLDRSIHRRENHGAYPHTRRLFRENLKVIFL